MISHKHRCIFIHIPRSGGSSIEDVVWPEPRREADLWMGFVSPHSNRYQTGGLQHLTARLVREVVGQRVFNEYFKFTFVRNPWDKAISQFAYLSQRGDLRRFLGAPEGLSFSDYLDRIGSCAHVQWSPQYDFLYDEDGEPLVDFVGRFERLTEDARTVFERLGISCPVLPHTRASAHPPYATYYDDHARRRIQDLYAKDISEFNYHFTG